MLLLSDHGILEHQLTVSRLELCNGQQLIIFGEVIRKAAFFKDLLNFPTLTA